MKDIESYLKEVEERVEKATKGPWVWDCGNLAVETKYGSPDYRKDICSSSGCVDLRNGTEKELSYWEQSEDMEFIAHSRTDVPYLVKTLRLALDHIDLITFVLEKNGARMHLDLDWIHSFRGDDK